MLMQIRGKVRQTECTIALNLRFPLNSGCKIEELLLSWQAQVTLRIT